MSELPRATIANPKSHYGSGKAATRAFLLQRLSGAANVIFLIFFVWFVASLAGADRAQMVETVRNPLVATLLGLMVIVVPIHMRIGMTETIEDYVHDEALNKLALTLNTVFASAIGLIGLIAVIKIYVWG